MILFTSALDNLQVVTAQATAVDVHVSWVDTVGAGSANVITPGSQDTAIPTATTTIVVPAPTVAGTKRNLQTLVIRNKGASNALVIQHTDGTTTVELYGVTLGAGESLQFVDGDGFAVFNSDGSRRETGHSLSDSVVALDGTAAAGTAVTVSRGDHKHADTNRPTNGQKAALPGTSGVVGSGNKYVTDADSRNADARTPTAHKTSHQDAGSDEISVQGLSGVLADPQPPIIGSGATQAVAGNDSRLSDARTPTAHAASHAAVGSDPVTITEAQVTGLVADLAEIEDDLGEKVNTTRSVISGGGLTGGGDLSADRTLAVGAGTGITVNADDVAVNYGTSSSTACVGNDSRLSDARTPTAHAVSHKSAGSDSIRIDELKEPTDVTTLNVTGSLHGLAPRSPGDATKFLNGADPPAYTTPSGGSGTVTNTGTLTADLPVVGNGGVDIKPLGSGALDLTSSGQIKFPATQAPSAGANVLDDYEEGTWTPADGSGQGLSLTIASATYTKIGRLVLARAYVTYPVTANGAAANVSGLPFTFATHNAFVINSNAAGISSFLGQLVSPPASVIAILTGAGVAITNAQLSAAYLIFDALYET